MPAPGNSHSWKAGYGTVNEQWIAPGITVVGVIIAAALNRARRPTAESVRQTEAETERTLIESMERVVDALEHRIETLEEEVERCETGRALDRRALLRITRALANAGIPIPTE